MILHTTDPYIIILKSQLQKALDAIKGEKQSAAIKKVEQSIWHTLSTVCDNIDASKPVVELAGFLSFLLCKSSNMETNSFIWLKLRSPTSNLKLK